jgi:hypothetical protein
VFIWNDDRYLWQRMIYLNGVISGYNSIIVDFVILFIQKQLSYKVVLFNGIDDRHVLYYV